MKKFTSNLSLNYQCMRFSSETGPNKEVKPYLLSSLNFVYEPDASSELSLAINNVLSRRDRTSNSSSDYYTEPATFMFNYTYKF
ncbi:MAG: TonB-dependent receptor, partial [Selenomonadaceae bacterium]|nr:TonB-dependent receptor [Selenomonadaceae bacterium]